MWPKKHEYVYVCKKNEVLKHTIVICQGAFVLMVYLLIISAWVFRIFPLYKLQFVVFQLSSEHIVLY